MPKRTREQVNNACIINPGELWADVVGYEGLYQVSTYGRIRKQSTFTVESTVDGAVIMTKVNPPFEIKQSLNTYGYMQFGLTSNGKTTFHRTNRVVAEAFIPHAKDQIYVHHIDRNPLNNCVSNLMWLTYREHDNMHKDKPRHANA